SSTGVVPVSAPETDGWRPETVSMGGNSAPHRRQVALLAKLITPQARHLMLLIRARILNIGSSRAGLKARVSSYNRRVNGDRSRESHNQLLRELNEERVAALRRISGTLESLIGQLHAARERVRQISGPEREREHAALRDLRA